MTNQILAEVRALMLNPPNDDIWARFCSFIDPQSWTQCWEWGGKRAQAGYGWIRCDGKQFNTHRLIWTWLTSIAGNSQATDHRWCDNPPCVNPLHTVPTSQRANVLRGNSVSGVNARKTHCKQGHPLTGDNLKPLPNAARQQRICWTCNKQWKRDAYRKKRQIS